MKKEQRTLLAGWLLIITAIIALASCSVEKQAQKKAAWLIAHDKLDDFCSRIYPPKDSISVRDSVSFDTLYVEQEGEVIHDTVFQQGETIVRTVTKQCPPAQVITKTVVRDTTIWRTNTADVDRMKGEVLEVQKQLKEKDAIVLKQQANIDKDNWWKIAAILTWCAIGIGFVLRFFVIKKPI